MAMAMPQRESTQPVLELVEKMPAAKVDGQLLYAIGDIHGCYDQLRALLARIAEDAENRAAGRTPLGPHRVDFAVTHAQKGMPAALGSTGEQKALLIGLVLAHARLVARMTGIVPFLLLDEIAAHLDPARRAALFAALDGLGTQCFLTGTDPVLFEALGGSAQTVRVADGRLQTAP